MTAAPIAKILAGAKVTPRGGNYLVRFPAQTPRPHRAAIRGIRFDGYRFVRVSVLALHGILEANTAAQGCDRRRQQVQN
jgi:hypothetical protein